MTDLGTLQGKSGYSGYSVGHAINDKGIVTGISSTSSGETHAFITDETNMMHDLGTLGGAISSGMGINEHNQVTGHSLTAGPGSQHAFVTDSAGNMKDLGTLGGATSSGQGINAAGAVTGISNNADGDLHAFVTDIDDDLIDLGTLGGYRSGGTSINDNGFIVGFSDTSLGSTHATLWDNNFNIFDLNEFVIDLNIHWDRLVMANDISNTGYITGYGITNDGFERAFLLTEVLVAVDEPPLLLLMSIGLIAMLTRRKSYGSILH